jgi:two-component system NtrC family sensor kinase
MALPARLLTSLRHTLLAYLPAAVWLLAALGAELQAHPRHPLALALALGGAALATPGRERRSWQPQVLAAAAIGAVLLMVVSERQAWLPGLAATTTLGVLWTHLVEGRRQIRALDSERRALAAQVDRRINEIFSLQELSYVLAESLQSDRIAGQVARYVMRFLNAEGAAVVLTGQPDGSLLVATAEGSLAHCAGERVTDATPSLVVRASTTERIEVTNGTEPEPVFLLPGHQVVTGAAAPLRAHGLTMGVLAVADRRLGGFTAEDLWLLSTVATHVAVVMANSRLFEMVRQAKEEWETAFNALSEGIAVLDPDGRLTRGNRALSRLLDLPSPALIGQPFWATVVGDADGENELIGAARRGERPAPLAIRSLTLGRVVRLTAAPVAETAERVAVVVLVEDVTEQRALETQLIQSEKLAAVGQLVSGVAHELNNPLTSIAGLSEFLQERPGIAAAEREHLRVIHEQAERAGRIVRNLLTFARKGSPGEAVVDLNDIVARTALLVAYELHLRGIELVEDRGSGELPVRGNRDELQQVFLNLVNNAVHAVRDLPGGTARRVTLSTRSEGGNAVVRVRDSGAGVREELVPQLFTPFFTTKEPGQGTGLGLSLSYRIVESHGGRLWYQPAAEGGAEFLTSIPLASPATDPAPPVPAADPDAARGILLIDGDAGSEVVVRALFEPAGYEVEIVRNGSEAVARFAARPWRLAVVDGAISADGRQLLVDRLAGHPGARLAITTADAHLAERCRTLGLTVLPRPFLPRDLLAAAGDLLTTLPGDQYPASRA